MPLCYHCFREKANDGPCPFCGYDGAEQAGRYPRALRPGTILNGRYIVGRVLGQGGFGITYLAQDYQNKERVAIKEYFPTEFVARATDAVSVMVDSANQGQNFDYGKAQFLEEARTLSNFIGNEHIVRIHSYFEENGTAYFVMEFIEGPSLDKYMRQFGGHLGVKEAKHLLLPLMEAMGEVHEKGIVHRDIAPDNIIVTGDGTAKLIDFGAARYSTGEKSKSLDVILKHGFAPYEQYMRRGRQGPWTDVYAMAATFYYAVTGKVPPEATERKEEDTLIPPSTFGVKIDDATEEALLKALEVRAADRFQSMADFCAAMRGEAPVARKPQAAPRGMEEAAAPVKKPVSSTMQPSGEQMTTPAAGKKKSKLPLVLAAVLVFAAAIFGVTRLVSSKPESPAMTEAPASAEAEPAIATPEPTPTKTGAEHLVELWVDSKIVLGLRDDGTVFAVGDNQIASAVSEWTDVVSIIRFYKDWSAITGNYGTTVLGLRSDGTVLSSSNEEGNIRVSEWTDIVEIGVAGGTVVGLSTDGTMKVTGENTNVFYVSGWKDIVSFNMYGGSDYGRIVGVKADGTVVATGKNNKHTCDVSDWTDVASIYLDPDRTIGLRRDGTVYDTSGYCSNWSDIESFSFAEGCIFGQKTDGSVCWADYHTVSLSSRINEVDNWSNIGTIKSYGFLSCEAVYGLRRDGTVAYAGKNDRLRNDLSKWDRVQEIYGYTDYLIGLRDNGTVVYAGEDEYNQKSIVESWSSIAKVYDLYNYTLGLHDDGTFVLAGKDTEYTKLCWTIDELNDAAGLGCLVGEEGHTSGQTSTIPTYTVGYVLEHYEELDGQTFYMEGYISSIWLNSDDDGASTSVYLVENKSDVAGYKHYSDEVDTYEDNKKEQNEREHFRSVLLKLDDQILEGIKTKDKLRVKCQLQDLGEYVDDGNGRMFKMRGFRLSFTAFEYAVIDE